MNWKWEELDVAENNEVEGREENMPENIGIYANILFHETTM